MIFNFNKPLNAEEIISNYDEISLYSYYLGYDIEDIRKLYTCPIHKDSSPSMGFYKSSKYLNYKCFGCGSTGNIFELVKNIYNIDYGKAIERIRKDFTTGDKEIRKFVSEHKEFNKYKEKVKTIIHPNFRTWTIIDYNYWKQFKIPLDMLINYNISPCSSVYYTNKLGEYKNYAFHSNNNPIYHYKLGSSSKIYRPLHSSKRGKWFQNCDSWDVQGMEQLPENGKRLFITSSLKDVMALKLWGEYAVAPHGEGILIPDKIMDYLFATWEEIILFYDNDKAGIDSALKHSNYYNIPFIYLKDVDRNIIKDPSDFNRYNGLEEGKLLLKKLL